MHHMHQRRLFISVILFLGRYQYNTINQVDFHGQFAARRPKTTDVYWLRPRDLTISSVLGIYNIYSWTVASSCIILTAAKYVLLFSGDINPSDSSPSEYTRASATSQNGIKQ